MKWLGKKMALFVTEPRVGLRETWLKNKMVR
jgi:hypothetical protein